MQNTSDVTFAPEPVVDDDSIPTRDTMLTRLKNIDDNKTWTEFFHRYWRLIYQFAIKAGLTESEAEEVVQETIIGVARSIPKFKYDPNKGAFKTWLLNLTRWRVMDQIRKRPLMKLVHTRSHKNSKAETATVARIAETATSDLEKVWNAEWHRNVLQAALERVRSKVSSTAYQIFQLSIIQQWPNEKVTKALRVNTGHVYLAKHRVRLLLEKELRKMERQGI